MSHIVVLGAGLGGTIMTCNLRNRPGSQHRISGRNRGRHYHFVPSRPWGAVGWRERRQVDLEPVFGRRDNALCPQGAERLDPAAKPA
ncbi:hypothetical protein [Devosia sp. A16]|uniref:hypothetical protein n=1 Tax=Devosia sp. A16 TaxID=1736675 RepID=UPI0012E117C2|nr:hypothetical protein [Devosia sp. A16]